MPLKRLIDRPKIDWSAEIAKALEADETKVELAKRLGVAFKTASENLEKHGVTLITASERKLKRMTGVLKDAKKRKLTIAQICDEQNMSRPTVMKWIAETGVEIDTGGQKPIGEKRGRGISVRATDDDWHNLFKEAIRLRKKPVDIVRETGLSASTVYRHSKRLGYREQFDDGVK